VLLDLSSGTYFGLNRVGTRIWQLLEAHGYPESVMRILEEEYDAPREVVRADTEKLIAVLVEKGLLRPADAPVA
jgi:hypothetical protein